MKHLSKLIATLPIALALCFGTPASAGVPVVDTMHNPAQVAEFLLNAIRWKDQMEQMIKDYQAKTEFRWKGAAATDGQQWTKNMYSHGFQQFFNDIGNAGNGHTNPYTESFRQGAILYDHCQGIQDWHEKSNCEAPGRLVAEQKAQMLTAMRKIHQRTENIDRLREQVNTTNDIKDSADLAARIQAEQVAIEANAQEIQMMLATIEAQAKVIEQQQEQLIIKHLDTDRTLKLRQTQWR
ncbi:MAG: type IV secretion system protein [Proteobacteria bacterium]|nr:type IV secretion system protein [Pseudomonadota bacterium]